MGGLFGGLIFLILHNMGGAMLPEMMRWLWRDGPVSTDPNDMAERGFREPAARKTAEAPQNN